MKWWCARIYFLANWQRFLGGPGPSSYLANWQFLVAYNSFLQVDYRVIAVSHARPLKLFFKARQKILKSMIYYLIQDLNYTLFFYSFSSLDHSYCNKVLIMVKLVLGMPKWSVVSKWFVAPTYRADIFLRPPFAEGGAETLMVPILSMLLIQIRLF